MTKEIFNIAEEEINALTLEDGSSIAVIGGGPAGSFFTYFALEFAQRLGIELSVDIYEAKNFNLVGPAGCNHCGGIISESLIQMLSAEGIVLPSKVIRRGIESYTLHMEQGSVVINTPFQEQRIASVYRGFGPLGTSNKEQLSFDMYLLDLCKQKGAVLIHEKMLDLERKADGIIVTSNRNSGKKYDLVVGSVGLNHRSFRVFKKVMPDFDPPETTKTYISEFYLGREKILEYFGHSMHVFLLNLDNVKFGALVPKGEYVTLVLLGNKIDKEIVDNFIHSTPVRNCFPRDIELKSVNPCQCFPSINIKNARNAYADRIVLIGDSSSSKLYKNGIGAAYITAKSAAKTAIFEGVSTADFKKNYQPDCTVLDKDNAIGKMIFGATTLIQKSSILKYGMFRNVVKEQQKMNQQRRLSAVLWDTFTGSAPYTDIMKRIVKPLTLLHLMGNIITGLFKPNNS